MYEEASKILDKYHTKSKIRQHLYKSNHPNVRQLMPLLENVLVNKDLLCSFLADCTKIDLNENMKLCLLYDMLFSKSRKAQQLKDLKDLSVRKQFLQKRAAFKLKMPDNIIRRVKPYKYARINGLKTSKDSLIREFGGTLKFDDDVPNLLCFKPNEDLANSELVEQQLLIIQDKASCLPALVLDPPSDAFCLDATASPGNKTLQLLENCNKVVACEKDFKRFTFMKNRFESLNAKIECLNDDFLLMDPISGVTHILLDPSCSGSGTLDYGVVYTDNDIIDFSILQFKMVKQCLKYPSLKQFTYSTCSINILENELIVLAILYYAKLLDLKLKLKSTRLEKFKSKVASIDADELAMILSANDIDIDYDVIGKVIDETDLEKCVRTNRQEHLTAGFFVALFELE
eukprot:NODE_1051_length_1696_cov_0.103319.p1 type:complete len:402 gc:universal NODE_1051_length_1696_cov_0.103319:1295-90(-)